MTVSALVFGAGGVGCIYATIFEKGGATVTTVCRSNYDAIAANGILVRSAKWGHIRSRPHATQSCEEAQTQHGPFDFVVVASKAFPETPPLIREAVTPGHTAIVLAQNGIDIEGEYARLYPGNVIISGVVYLPTTQVEPGVVEHGTPLERFEIGTFPANASPEAVARAKEISALFAAGDATAPFYEDIQQKRWEKLSVNASLNPVTALTLCDDGNLMRSSSEAASLIKDIMREVGQLAKAAGYPTAVTEAEIEVHMERHQGRAMTGGKQPSMLVDVLCNRPMEVDAILGNAVKRATDLGVQVPLLRMLHVLAKGRNFAILRNAEWKPIATVI